MADVVEHIDGSLIQHGKFNNRVYLMHLNTDDTKGLIGKLENLAFEKGYGKLFAKIPATAWPVFQSYNYMKEAEVPGLFNGRIDGYFIAKYFSTSRQNDPHSKKLWRELCLNETKTGDPLHQSHQNDQIAVACDRSDVGEMSSLYRKVFRSYPFPIHKTAYLTHMIDKGVRYFGIRNAGRLVALAATEIDAHSENCEMTDFATLPEWRGMEFAWILLGHMDSVVAEKGIKTTYTIARAGSKGINRVFHRQGYQYAGCLKNNTQIAGAIESMFVWYKRFG